MHTMMTRSKAKQSQIDPPKDIFYDASDQPSDSADSCESLDSHGNLKDLIDDTQENTKETAEALLKLKHIIPESIESQPKHKRKKTNKNKRGPPTMNEMLMSLLVLKATEKANLELRKQRKQKHRKQKHKKKSKIEVHLKMHRGSMQMMKNRILNLQTLNQSL